MTGDILSNLCQLELKVLKPSFIENVTWQWGIEYLVPLAHFSTAVSRSLSSVFHSLLEITTGALEK